MPSADHDAPLDLVIAGGRVIDGSGGPSRVEDVGLVEGRIVALGDLARRPARARLDASDLAVAPGFIDGHTHDDRAVFATPDMTAKISQGVTSVVAGNCGVSLAPLDPDRDPPPPMNLIGGKADYRFPRLEDYRAALEAEPPALNLALLVGHSTLRLGAMDDLGRAASAREIGAMGERLEAALEAGALGLSSGLAYPTAAAAPTAEVTALAERLAPYGAIHATHMRDEGDHLIEAVAETIEIGRAAGVASLVSHHKATGRPNWGKTERTLAMIDEARAGQAIDFDVYPYVASSTVLLPDFVVDCDKVLIAWSKAEPDAAGRSLDALAEDWGCSEAEAIARLQPAGAIYFQMDEAELRRVLAHPRALIGSDGLPHDVRPHPRLWGTFPRVLGHYARDLGLFSLEEAVHKMTGRPAEVFGLKGRGVIAEGNVADLVLFDPETVIDRADYDDPMQPAAGIKQVMVAGRTVWDGEAWTGNRAGRFLEREA